MPIDNHFPHCKTVKNHATLVTLYDTMQGIATFKWLLFSL